jgi:hypothetical protein
MEEDKWGSCQLILTDFHLEFDYRNGGTFAFKKSEGITAVDVLSKDILKFFPEVNLIDR